jgi:hypothetical protein
MRSRGFSLAELLVALGVFLTFLTVGLPVLATAIAHARLLGAARVFKGEFLRARSIAARSGAYTALRFETRDGRLCYTLYGDANRNGILSAEIASGVDYPLGRPMNGNVSGVEPGILPGVPALPPERGALQPGDPIRFGRSRMISFSPLGTATPGTFYLAHGSSMAAVRVTPGSARVRVMLLVGERWVER